jgi:hypothetical protein
MITCAMSLSLLLGACSSQPAVPSDEPTVRWTAPASFVQQSVGACNQTRPADVYETEALFDPPQHGSAAFARVWVAHLELRNHEGQIFPSDDVDGHHYAPLEAWPQSAEEVDLLACSVGRVDHSAKYSNPALAGDPFAVVRVSSYAMVLWMVNARTGAFEGGPWVEPAPALSSSVECRYGCSVWPDAAGVMWDIATFMQLPEPFRTFIP